jgi:hypothetical protein
LGLCSKRWIENPAGRHRVTADDRAGDRPADERRQRRSIRDPDRDRTQVQDIWLDNGGVGGLEDLFVSIAPKLPWGLKGKLIYHRFWSEFSSAQLGDEIDIVLAKKLGHGFSVLTKGAYSNSTGASRALGKSDTWRGSIQLDYDF